MDGATRLPHKLHPVDQLLQNLELVKQYSPGRWRAKCPVHQDSTSKSRTLVIFEREDGSASFHCHAGCDFDAVLGTLDLQRSELFPTDTFIHQTRYAGKLRKNLRLVIDRSREAATIVEIGARMLLDGEQLSQDDLYTLAGVASDLREMLDV